MTVVLPASMWAMIPMLRFSSGSFFLALTGRGETSFFSRVVLMELAWARSRARGVGATVGLGGPQRLGSASPGTGRGGFGMGDEVALPPAAGVPAAP